MTYTRERRYSNIRAFSCNKKKKIQPDDDKIVDA